MIKNDFLILPMVLFGTLMVFTSIEKDMTNMGDIMMTKPKNIYQEKDGIMLIIAIKMNIMMMIMMMNMEVIMKILRMMVLVILIQIKLMMRKNYYLKI